MKVRLIKNRTGYSVALSILRDKQALTASHKLVDPVLYLLPGQCVDVKDILVSDPGSTGYNEDLLRNYVRRHIITELLLEVVPNDPQAQSFNNYSWKMSAPLNTKRALHTAEILSSGRVLIIGGFDGQTILNSTEVFDSNSNEWIPGPSMAKARYAHSSVKLLTGDVLIIGGYNTDDLALNVVEKFPSYYEIVNIFNGQSAYTTTVASMATNRIWPGSILLNDGRVLVTGGYNAGGVLSSCEIYNPTNNLWASVDPMVVQRAFHSIVKLPDGRILVAGGYNGTTTVNSVEIFDPQTGGWSTVNPMTEAREDHLSFILDTGEVLVLGGSKTVSSVATKLGTAEIYDPENNIWSAVGSLPIPSNGLAGVLLANGKPLITGGESTELDTQKMSVIFNSNIFKATSNSLVEPRQNHTLTKLLDGRVIAVGGHGNSEYNETSELFSRIVSPLQ